MTIFHDKRAQNDIYKALKGISQMLPSLLEVLQTSVAIKKRAIENDLANLNFALPLVENSQFKSVLDEYNETEVVNFLANIDDLIDEITESIRQNKQYLNVIEELMQH
ncbi:hypothetical protein [Leuconostoc citreum]|uniref:hypothetical protein n=1 Tax=Leuconostoc citreum TaxID=33964 RepID=UPI0032DF68B6